MTALGCVQTPQTFDRPLVVSPSFAAGSPHTTKLSSHTLPTLLVMSRPDWHSAPAALDPSLLTISRKQPAQGHPAPVASSYEVLGQRYHVLASSKGYVRQGRATWYGKDFHGKPTASGEIYDMHALSAAHRSLPLDSCLLVTNKENNRRVVVKVIDRGPFVKPFFLDLSYEAARRLRMVEQGSALVEARAIGQHTCQLLADRLPQPKATQRTARKAPPPNDTQRLVQLGAFQDHQQAKKLLDTIHALGYSAFIRPARGIDAGMIYRIILGLPDAQNTRKTLNLTQQLIAAAAQLNRYQ